MEAHSLSLWFLKNLLQENRRTRAEQELEQWKQKALEEEALRKVWEKKAEAQEHLRKEWQQ